MSKILNYLYPALLLQYILNDFEIAISAIIDAKKYIDNEIKILKLDSNYKKDTIILFKRMAFTVSLV